MAAAAPFPTGGPQRWLAFDLNPCLELLGDAVEGYGGFTGAMPKQHGGAAVVTCAHPGGPIASSLGSHCSLAVVRSDLQLQGCLCGGTRALLGQRPPAALDRLRATA